MGKKKTKKITKKKNVTETEKKSSKVNTYLEENKDLIRMIICTIIILIILVVGYIIGCKINDNKEETNINVAVITEDEKRFKNEFESSSNSVVSVKIKEDNNVKYVSVDEAVQLLASGSGIILFGNSNDTNTRLMVNNVIDNLGDKTLYYLDIINNGVDVRDEYIISNNKAELSRAGAVGYSDLLYYLDNYLEEYQIVKKDGKKVSAGEKRLNIPLLVKIDKGNIVMVVNGVGNSSDYKKLISS